MAVKDYLELIRFRYHITFLLVIIISLYYSPNIITVGQLILLYISFNVFLYGGIYTLNAITDRRVDAKHPQKKKRPIPSGRVSVTNAIVFMIVLLLAGFISAGAIWGRDFELLFLAFLLVNVFYSLVARNIPYLELIGNSLTYPLRFLMGVMLVGAQIDYYLLLSILLGALGLSILRRRYEKKIGRGRSTLQAYSDTCCLYLETVMFAGILFLFLLAYPSDLFIHLLLIVIYVVIVMGSRVSSEIQRFVKWLW